MKKFIYLLLIAFALISCNKEELVKQEVQQEFTLKSVQQLTAIGENKIEHEFFILEDGKERFMFYKETDTTIKQIEASETLKQKMNIPVLTFNCQNGAYRYYLDTTTFAWFELDTIDLSIKRVSPEKVEAACG